MQMECVDSSSLSENVLMHKKILQSEEKPLIHLRRATLCGCNRLHFAVGKNNGSVRLKLYFPTEIRPLILMSSFKNMCFAQNVIKEGLAGFRFDILSRTFIDRSTGTTEEQTLTKVYAIHLNLVPSSTEC